MLQKSMLLLAGLLLYAGLNAQAPEPYKFREFKKLEATPIKNQGMSGTCWAFSSASFLESEALRLGKGQHNLSEMFVVRHVYRQKCENYVRRKGDARFSEGGLAHDLLNAVKQYGVAPEDAYPGRKDPSKPFNHGALEKSLRETCDAFIKQADAGSLQPNWMHTIDSLLDVEFGPLPEKFTVNGMSLTPLAYRDYLSLNPDDYVNITSFTHHPYYSKFILEVQDNFSNGQFYNLPISELMQCLNYSIQQGFTVEWDADVSNNGFSARNGLAVVPELDWNQKNKEQQASTFKYWEKEKQITQDYRQDQFDRMITQDDHLMHITGILDEVHSGAYYVVKNSWGEISDLKGYVNVSESYMRLNTISFTVHKDALPTDIKKRLGLLPGDVRIEKTGSTITPVPPKKATEKPADDKAPGKIVSPKQQQQVQPKNKTNGN